MPISSSLIITSMRVIPVGGRDSMLLNLCGAHGPYFTRNLVLLEASDGRTGIAEVPGGDGAVAAADKPGLGIEPDMDRIEQAHALYKQVAQGARDDAAAMQYLVPGWTYDPKRPGVVRNGRVDLPKPFASRQGA